MLPLYYMNAAGLPLEGSANFWRQNGGRNTRGVLAQATQRPHPATSERFSSHF